MLWAMGWGGDGQNLVLSASFEEHTALWGVRGQPPPDFREMALNTMPTPIKGTGNRGMSPRVLLSLKLPWMGLEDPL